jgi:diguanylate cyclase (GGDEF)-like protein
MLSPSCSQGSCYCINISGREYSKSLLQLYSPQKNTFNHQLVSSIKSYAEVTRLLVINHRSLHVLNEKANTDKLTGLYNRYFLDCYLENQLEASMLSGQPLSLILTDIDDFKDINDTYGHQGGDILLTHFSETVLGSLRKSDAMVRYGGDEFIIILPCTEITTARVISERIRNLVNSTDIPAKDGIKLPRITCSLGISSFPDPAADAAELIKQADKALYAAKNNGSNKTCVGHWV